ncbi:hypothetical protein JNUCC31_19000 [Paenibacillus sp. JNUCC31]|uniref:hypothetical protein n=1 Tax=Paenibacillus sp. JNUCC-31 TaxID=2777983 RepID=UPI00177EC402|nr:hypothetical protein [Paenibacillus sp. JNUCC-31]QOS76916.1 hypothetical protein JNUCC31_19000 [Paenibacillus sp. JNUCC-31]
MLKWNKKKFLIGLFLVCLVVIAACSGKEKTDEEKLTELLKDTIVNSGNIKESSSEVEPPTVESELREINNFLTMDIWNDGFVNISSYTRRGTDALGQTLDIDFLIERLGKSMEKKAEYDTYIQGLDPKYDDLKQVWTKLSNETDILYNTLKDNKPTANDEDYKFDTGLYSQYKDAFSNDVMALNP